MQATQDQLKAAIKKYVFDQNEPVVVSIVGSWGEGKTWFWKNEIEQEYLDKNTGYISVFGVNSLDEFRQRVIACAIELLGKQTKQRFKDRIPGGKRLGQVSNFVKENWHHVADKISETMGIPDKMATQLLESKMLKEGWVLCIDDLERASDSINIIELMGYINLLKEDHGLKIILIYNDQVIESNHGEYTRYHEKVIDWQLRFSPDLKSVIERIFDEENDSYIDKLIEKCRVLCLTNNRILSRVKHMYSQVVEVLPDHANEEYLFDILNSLMLYVWIRYGQHEYTVLSLDYMREYESLIAEMRANEDKDEESKNAHSLISDYGYIATNSVDQVLIQFVETDLLDKDKIIMEYEAICSDVESARISANHQSVWQQKFHGTLVENETEFCDQLITATREYLEHIALESLDITLMSLIRLGRKEDADRLFEEFKTVRSGDIQSKESSAFGEKLDHKELVAFVDKERNKNTKDTRDVSQVLRECDMRLLSQKDRKRLAEFSKEEYIDYFMSHSKEGLVKEMYQLGRAADRITNPDEELLKIKGIMQSVAKEIADMSELNKMRMERTGLLVDN